MASERVKGGNAHIFVIVFLVRFKPTLGRRCSQNDMRKGTDLVWCTHHGLAASPAYCHFDKHRPGHPGLLANTPTWRGGTARGVAGPVRFADSPQTIARGVGRASSGYIACGAVSIRLLQPTFAPLASGPGPWGRQPRLIGWTGGRWRGRKMEGQSSSAPGGAVVKPGRGAEWRQVHSVASGITASEGVSLLRDSPCH